MTPIWLLFTAQVFHFCRHMRGGGNQSITVTFMGEAQSHVKNIFWTANIHLLFHTYLRPGRLCGSPKASVALNSTIQRLFLACQIVMCAD